MILIHGLAASLYDWNDLIPELSKAGFSVYALDLPGHGMSNSPEFQNKYNIEQVFSSFCDWFDRLELVSPATLIGHSLGAYIALRYAALYPTQVSSLVLCDPFFCQTQLPYLLRLNYKLSFIDLSTISIVPQWLIRVIIDFASLSIRNGFRLPKNVRDQTAADYKRVQPGIFKIIPSVVDISPLFRSIFQPTLVIWGEKDRTLDTRTFSKLVGELPNSRGYSIEGAGHVPHQSHASEFNQQVLEFILDLKISITISNSP